MTTERPGGAAGTGGRSTANGAEPRLPDTPDSLIFAGVQDQLGRAVSARDDDEDDEENLDGEPSGESSDELDDDAEGDDDAEQQEARGPDDSEQQQPPKERAQRLAPEAWGKRLASEGLQHISQIPNAMLRNPALLEAYGAERARIAAERTQATITENLRQQEQLERFVREVDDHFADDPDGKLDWIETSDQGPVYAQAKRYIAQSKQQTPEERVGAAAASQALNERATRQYDRLQRYPDLQAELVRRQTAEKKYPATPEGVAALERDVDELLEQGITRGTAAAGGNGAASGSQPSERRRPARPFVSAGGGSEGPRRRGEPDITKINDPDALAGIGVAQGLAALRSRPRR